MPVDIQNFKPVVLYGEIPITITDFGTEFTIVDSQTGQVIVDKSGGNAVRFSQAFASLTPETTTELRALITDWILRQHLEQVQT